MNASDRGKGSNDHRAVEVWPRLTAEARRRREERHATLLAEELTEMPETLDMPAFERLVLKFALHFMRDATSEHREALLRANPVLIIPEELALRFKDQILQEIPPCFVSFSAVTVHDKVFPRGRYRFVKPIPSRVIYGAMRRAGLIK